MKLLTLSDVRKILNGLIKEVNAKMMCGKRLNGKKIEGYLLAITDVKNELSRIERLKYAK